MCVFLNIKLVAVAGVSNCNFCCFSVNQMIVCELFILIYIIIYTPRMSVH